MRARHGFTLVETLIAVVMVSLLMLIAFPKVRAAIIKTDLRSARTAVVNSAARARAVATEGSRISWLTFDGNRMLVTAAPRRTPPLGGGVDTVGQVLDLEEAYGVGVTGPTSIQFNPNGLSTGLATAQTISLARDGHTENVQLDGLGRVTK